MRTKTLLIKGCVLWCHMARSHSSLGTGCQPGSALVVWIALSKPSVSHGCLTCSPRQQGTMGINESET